MKKIAYVLSLCFLISCSKQDVVLNDKNVPAEESATAVNSATTAYTTYTILAGQHSCDKSTLKFVNTSEMNFTAKFNSSAIYTSVLPENQYDINKLWGFSEGFNHQYNSARIGWSWNNGALRLYGYVYASGVRYSREITSIVIGTDITCRIKLSGNSYIFTVNGTSIALPRGPSSTQASGLQLYPYFGGDETAPHTITIQLRNL